MGFYLLQLFSECTYLNRLKCAVVNLAHEYLADLVHTIWHMLLALLSTFYYYVHTHN